MLCIWLVKRPAGTIWRGNEVIEGVLESLELLRKLVRVILLVTFGCLRSSC
jgi:ribonucleotide monophosphatase NagD (HAD superfamily)